MKDRSVTMEIVIALTTVAEIVMVGTIIIMALGWSF